MKRFLAVALSLLVLAMLFLLRPRASAPPAGPLAASPTVDAAPAPVPEAPTAVEAPAPDGKPQVPESVQVMPKGLRWLQQRQNEDGSWGDGISLLDGHPIDRVGTTSLVLLALLGAGYTHLSKDEWEGKPVGEMVKNALRWLQGQMGPDGTFVTNGDPDLNQALGALALNEAFGMSGSAALRDGAGRSFGAVQARQRADGSWGDSVQGAWAAGALVSARISGLSPDPGALSRAGDNLAARLDGGVDVPALGGHLFLNRDAGRPSVARTREWIASVPPEWSQQSFGYWYFGSHALFQLDGPKGPTWTAWSARLKETLLRNQGADGSWPAPPGGSSIVASALATLTLEVYYRYANTFGSASTR